MLRRRSLLAHLVSHASAAEEASLNVPSPPSCQQEMQKNDHSWFDSPETPTSSSSFCFLSPRLLAWCQKTSNYTFQRSHKSELVCLNAFVSDIKH